MPPRTNSSTDAQPNGRGAGLRAAGALALAMAVSLSTGAPSWAQSGTSGGSVYVTQPKIAKVRCARLCASKRRAKPGSVLQVTGSGLGSVTSVTFLGNTGRGDDVPARVRAASETRLSVRVPTGASSGPVRAAVSTKLHSRSSRPVAILPPPPPEPNPTLTPVLGPRERGAPRLETGTSSVRAFYGARRAVTFSYRITGGAPSSVRIELVQARDGAVVASWTPPGGSEGVVNSLTWNGRLGTVPAALGRYSFRLTVAGSSGAIARSAQAEDHTRDAFDLYDHVFPVRARHDFGGAGARFGAGRAGHIHQGHDVLAACGTRLVAARGGRVKTKAYHRAAGNYLVIDGAGTGIDYVYMHLAQPSPFEEGDRVYTGQQIGVVGETGDARGCHLHFEMWSAPGWYSGGKPFDPLPSLRSWDAWS